MTPGTFHLAQSLRAGLLGRALAALLLLFVLPPVCAHAQFSGPAPRASRATNAPVIPTTDPAVLYPKEHDVELLPGDQLSIHLFEQSDYISTVRISLDGSVDLPLIGIVHISGLTLHAAERLIEERLVAAGMYRKPQISIQVVDSPNQVITVIGEVHSVVPSFGGRRRLFDVIAAAGGIPVTASHVLTINRPGVDQPIIVDLGQDPQRSRFADVPVFAGDTIIVARVAVVYILGAFRNQGAIPIQASSPLTLMQATALANGAGFEGKYQDLRIVRTVGLERQVLHVDIAKVLNGKAPDPILQADDIVFLPTSAFKAAIKSGGIGTALGILSLLIYVVTATS